ncbi:hypothetical protein ABB26_10140 [Stenotrophomonas humi]|uniref:Uncharacterized protein n=1 Tax=Stenotrophomonas humi TaxID=405444 RepID=A0A0R0C3Y3_9GAMM|nr:hypothetical protein [Stenotrophomonas humi]KRG63926.1 hypothetical protein ABB26_10140 [Stenotrophomonas humi]
MSMLDGVSQCWLLSETCVVWWDAWAVLVGAFVGIATVVVAARSWLTSNRAADIASDTAKITLLSAEIAKDSARIAEEAKIIAERQHEETINQRRMTAQILGSLLHSEIAMLPVRLGSIIETLDEATIAPDGTVIGREELNWIFAELSHPCLPAAESALDRLHCLEQGLGEQVAQLIGLWKTIGVAAKRAAGRVPKADSATEVVIPKNANGFNDYMLLRTSLLSLLAHSIAAARNFAKFTGSHLSTYDHEESLIKRAR